MSGPRFSIVVPTRQRHETLRHCLRTCLAQGFDDYEVIVCDNCSSPQTRQVVEEQAAPRLRYLRMSEPLAMSANWERALSEVQGEYVLVLGDDDGLMPYGLAELDGLLRRTGAVALRFDQVLYTWPDFADPGQANYLHVPLSRDCRTVDGREQIREVLDGRAGYWTLPMVYNSAVRRDLLDEARRRAGRVFVNAYPDVYSGMAIAYLAGEYLSTTVPMGVSGMSGKSNGVALLRSDGSSPIVREFNELNAQFGYRPHPWVPDLSLDPVPDADSFQWAKEALFPDDASLELDRKRLAERCLKALWVTDVAGRRQAIDRIRASLADRPDLLAWFEGLAPEQAAPGPRPRVRPEVAQFDGQNLGLEGDRFGVADVAGAAEFATRLLGYVPGRICYDLLPRWDRENEYIDHIARLKTATARLRADVSSAQEAYYSLYHSWSCFPLRLVHGARRLLGKGQQAG